MALTSRVQIVLSTTHTNALDLSTSEDTLSINNRINLANGTGIGQASKIFHDQRGLGANANEVLDLTTGLTDAFGTDLNFSSVKTMIFEVVSGSGISIGGAASTAFDGFVADPTDVITVGISGVLALVAPHTGYTVDATHKSLKILNGAASGVYNIALIGT